MNYKETPYTLESEWFRKAKDELKVNLITELSKRLQMAYPDRKIGRLYYTDYDQHLVVNTRYYLTVQDVAEEMGLRAECTNDSSCTVFLSWDWN